MTTTNSTKPEYLRENVQLFGYHETIELMARKLIRAGKTKRMAYLIAARMLEATIF